MIQERFNKLSPYITGLKLVEKYNVIESSLKRTWNIQTNDNIKHQKTDKGDWFFSETLTFDEMLDWLEHDVISYNLEIEEKERLLKTKIEELKEVFENSSLDELNELQFTKDGDVLKLYTDKNKEKSNGVTEELPKTE